ncbi:MAG: DoxX family protein [Myroides sp.]|jgi:uncharacterized membrane protein YphA (DoxX/SURF4 family)|nr:DoxX family protein [Myroides sp.]
MKTTITQLFLRIAISISFLSAVGDRLGYWGKPGELNVSWGNWENFLAYSNSLNSFFSPTYGQVLALLATLSEITLAVMLLIGFKIKHSAIASGILLTLFAVAMSLSIGIKVSFDYSVWIGASACFLLSGITYYPYSLDSYWAKKRK